MGKGLVFGDVGFDDVRAWIYVLLTKKIDVIGTVAEYGNVPRYTTVWNVEYYLKKLSKLTIHFNYEQFFKELMNVMTGNRFSCLGRNKRSCSKRCF